MSSQTKSSAPDGGGAIVSCDERDKQDPTLKSGPATRERLGRLLEGGSDASPQGALSPRNPPSKSLNRVPPSEPIGDTRVRAAPYRLLSTCIIATTAQIDGRGKYRAGGLSARAFKGFLGRENL